MVCELAGVGERVGGLFVDLKRDRHGVSFSKEQSNERKKVKEGDTHVADSGFFA